MMLGLSTYSYHLAFGRHGDCRPPKLMDLFSCMDRLVEHGLQGFQIDPRHLLQADDEYLEVVREEAEARRLFIEYSATAVEPDALRRATHVCRRLGAWILRVCLPFSRFDRHTDVRREIDRAKDWILLSLPDIETQGIRLAVDNHRNLRAEELVGMVEEIGSAHVGISLDPADALSVMEDPLAAAKHMLPFTLSVRLKDYLLQPTASGFRVTGAPLGQGMVPVADLYRLIEEEGMVDRVILEVPLEGGHGDRHAIAREEEAVSASVRYCREVLGIGVTDQESVGGAE
jgi:sugar phosphate isomerase/epimerase